MIYVDDAHCFVGILQAAEGEVGDVDLVLAEQRADAPNDAGNILIAYKEQKTFERRFDVNVVHAENTQHIVESNHAKNGRGFPVGAQGDAERIRVRGAAPAAYLYDLDPARFRKISRVNQVDGISQDLAEDAFQHGIFHQVSIQVREAAVIADGNFGNVFVGELRDERAQLLSQLQVRLELLELLWRNGWHVNGVAHRA